MQMDSEIIILSDDDDDDGRMTNVAESPPRMPPPAAARHKVGPAVQDHRGGVGGRPAVSQVEKEKLRVAARPRRRRQRRARETFHLRLRRCRRREIPAAVPDGAAARPQAAVVVGRAACAVADVRGLRGRRFRRAGVEDDRHRVAAALGRGQGVRAVRVSRDGRAAGHVHVEDGGRDRRPPVAGGLRAHQLSAGRSSHRAQGDRRARPARAVLQVGGQDLTEMALLKRTGSTRCHRADHFPVPLICFFHSLNNNGYSKKNKIK